jgi:hypothetical protein
MTNSKDSLVYGTYLLLYRNITYSQLARVLAYENRLNDKSFKTK